MFPVHRLKVRIEHPAFYLETDDIHGTVNEKINPPARRGRIE